MNRRNWLLSSLRTCAVAAVASLIVGAGRRITRECVGVSGERCEGGEILTFHFSDGSHERRKSALLTMSDIVRAIRTPELLWEDLRSLPRS